jgi:uncharacterized protein with GYD domain
MATYMIQISYTPEHFAALGKQPRDRTEDIRGILQRTDGRLIGFWYSFGDQDAVLIFEAPNEKAAAAAVLTGISGGHIRSSKTTQLLHPKDAVEAMSQAAGANFQAPGGRR